MNKKNVTMAAALAVVLTMIGAMALGGCSGNSPGEPSAPDTAALDAAIDAAETAKSGVAVDTDAANVAVGTKWVTQAESSALETAITAAQAVAANSDAAQEQIDAAAATLATATTAFNAAKKEGTKAASGPSAADKTALNAALEAAPTAKTGVVADTAAANVPAGTKWVTQADMTAFEAAITEAQAVSDNSNATQSQVDTAVTALTTATTTFNESKQDGTGATQDATAFTTAHGATVNKDATTVAVTDKTAVNNAITAYNALSAAAKALLPGDTLTKLQTLLDRINALEAAAFTAAHGGTASKDIASVVIADKTAINAAITVYNGLSSAAKALLASDTLTKLQALLNRINSLGTAENITLDFTDDGALLDPVENLTIGAGQTLTVTAATGLMEIQWSLGGVDIPAPRGTAQSIVIAAANYPAGQYLLGLAATKGAVVCSTEITFTVTE